LIASLALVGIHTVKREQLQLQTVKPIKRDRCLRVAVKVLKDLFKNSVQRRMVR
jgi:hypothetical protein